MSKRTRIRVILLGAGIAAILAIAGVAAVIAAGTDGPAEPGKAGAPTVTQAASSTAAGVTLTALQATFSGTETVVRIGVNVDPQGLPAEIRQASIRSVLPDVATITTQGVAPAHPSVGGERDAFLLTLAPLSGETPVQVSFGSLLAVTDAGRVRIPGSWTLAIETPKGDSLKVALRTEGLALSQEADPANRIVALKGLRSTTRTLVTYRVADGLEPLSEPRMRRSDSSLVFPIQVSSWPDGSVTAGFEPTPFGSSVSFEFGPFAISTDVSPHSKQIRVADVLRRSARSDAPLEGVYAVDSSDQSGSDDVVVKELRFHQYQDSRRSIVVVVDGNWPANSQGSASDSHDSWTLLDNSGKLLAAASYGSGFSKDASGNIGPGTTFFGSFFDARSDISAVTLVLGRIQSIAQDRPTLQFKPE